MASYQITTHIVQSAAGVITTSVVPSLSEIGTPGVSVVETAAISGPPGPKGDSGSGAIEYPLTAASSFYQAHLYDYPPDARAISAAGDLIDYGVEYPDPSHVSIEFPQPFTGTVILS